MSIDTRSLLPSSLVMNEAIARIEARMKRLREECKDSCAGTVPMQDEEVLIAALRAPVHTFYVEAPGIVLVFPCCWSDRESVERAIAMQREVVAADPLASTMPCEFKIVTLNRMS